MGKKLQEKLLLCLLFFPVIVLGQCPDSVPTVTITNQTGTSVCENETINFSASPNPSNPSIPYTFQWQVQLNNGTWTDISGQNSKDLINYDAVIGSNRIRLQVGYCSGESETNTINSPNSATITVYPIKTGSVNISASKTNICPGENIQFSSSPQNHGGSGATYEWRLLNNNSILSNSSSFNSTNIPDGAQVKLFMTSSVPCVEPFESNTLTISHKEGIPAQPSSISGSTTICPNSSDTFSVTNDPTATSYIWTLPNGWTGSSNTNSINITTGSASTSAKTLSVKAINDCGESELRTLDIIVGPGQPNIPSTITVDSGNDNLICPGETIQLSVSNDNSVSSYTWELPTGWTGTSTSNAISVTAGNYNQNGVISVFSTNECLNSESRTITLNVNEPAPSQPGAISGPADICPGESYSYSISSVQYADEYEWYLDGNLINGTPGNSFNFNSTDVGSHELEVLAKNECGESSRSLLNINIDNGAPDAIAIKNSISQSGFCEGSTDLKFSVPADAKVDNYAWNVPSGWAITSGQNTNEITVTAGSFGQNGTISLSASSDDCGEVAATYAVTVKNPVPAKPDNISGPVQVCSGSTNTFTVAAVQYATSYEWLLPNGTTQVTNNPTINFSTSVSGNVNLSVKAINECGIGSSSNSYSYVSYGGAPGQPGAITSSLGNNPNICPPLSQNVSFSIDPVSNATGYNWVLPSGWNIVSGANTNNISVNITASGNYNSPESITVAAINICGTSSTSTFGNIGIDDYILTDIGPDRQICRNSGSIVLDGKIQFGNKKFNPQFTASTGSFSNIPTNTSGDFQVTYNPPANFSGNVSISMSVPKPNGKNSSCGNGKDEMVLTIVDDPTASFSSTPSEICYNGSTALNVTGTPNTTLTYSNGTGTNTINLDTSGNGVINTGNLSSSTTYSLQSIEYTTGPGCSQNLTESLAITVNPLPDAVISYSGPFCNDDSNSYVPSFANTAGNYENGKFSASGISIDENTGAISPNGVEADTYTITYNFSDPLSCGYQSLSSTVTIKEGVSIVTQPSDLRLCEGEDISINVEASGDELSYQWYKGSLGSGTPLTGETSSTFSKSNVVASDAGIYYVEISGASSCSVVSSNQFEIKIDQSITIDSEPVDATVCLGDIASFSVSTSSEDATLSYQWFKGTPGTGSAISGETSQTLEISGAALADSDNYYVVIAGDNDFICDAVTSQLAVLTVRDTPKVQISGTTEICEGGDAEIYFTNGTPNALVSYIVNSGSIQTIELNADGEAVLNTGSLSITNDEVTTYTYQLNNVAYSDAPECSNNMSGSAVVSVNPTPKVDVSFENEQVSFCNDSYQGTFTPKITGSGAIENGVFSAEGLNVDPETGAFTPANATAGAYTMKYYLEAGGGCSELAATLDITISTSVSITSEPFPVAVCSANSTQLEMAASGDNLSYQWFKKGSTSNTEVGTDSPVLELNNVTASDAGEYFVIVSGNGSCASAESETVVVTVDENIVITQQPTSKTVCLDDEITLTVAATASGSNENIIYKWMYRPAESNNDADWTYVAGGEGQSLNVSAISTSQAGQYRAEINGPDNYSCDLGYSEAAIIDVNEPVEVDAGKDFAICSTETTISLGNDAAASNYSSLLWTTNGSGTLDNETTLTPSYTIANGEKGEITFTLTAQGNGNCSEVVDNLVIKVEMLPVINSMNYSASEFCVSVDTPQSINLNLSNASITDGSFTYTGESGKSLNLNSENGAIDPSNSDPGNYTVKFTIPASTVCEAVSESIEVVIGELPNADFSYSTAEICRDTRNENGSFKVIVDGLQHQDNDSFAGTSGLIIDATTGEIDLNQSVAGEHTITRTVDYSGDDEDGCEAVTATFNIKIFDKPIPDFSYASSEFCSDGSDPSPTAVSNGVFGEFTYAPAEGEEGIELTINSNTGDIDLDTSDPGTYIIKNSVDLAEDACEKVSFEFSITIYEKKDPTFSYTSDSYCISQGVAKVDHSNFVTGGNFSSATLDSDYLNPSTGEITWSLTDEFITTSEHTIRYTLPANGTCEAVYSEYNIKIDALPEGGLLEWSNEDRIFLTCEIQTNDLQEILTLKGNVGIVDGWEYRTTSNLNWTPYNSTDSSLSNSDFISILGGNAVETTVFRARIVNGACNTNIYSQTAILSVIPSDIRPEPVRAEPQVICYGNEISLSSSIKYVNEIGKFEGGDFTNAGIKNDGWNFTDPNGNEISYDANADSGTPIHWHKTQPKWKFTTANINSPYNTSEMWWNPRNDGQTNEHFAIAQSTFSSNMDTPPFSLLATDEAILTFDQAYNLTTDATIRVVLLKNGAEYKELYKVTGSASSGNYDHFGYGTPGVNQMEIDLGSYIGESNLRIRFEYRGVRLGDVWAIDNIKVPEGPQDVLLQWFYDDKDPNTAELEQIGVDNQSTVTFKPRKIGWNNFEVKTALLLDSNGNPCEDINNSETIRVYVFDQYNTTVEAEPGECGNTVVQVSAKVTGDFQGDVTGDFTSGEFKTADGYSGSWIIEGPDQNYTLSDSDPNDDIAPVNNPVMTFEAEQLGLYTFKWVLTSEAIYPDDYKDDSLRGELIENTGCPPIVTSTEVDLPECTTLDFDGINDFVSIDDVFADAKTIEMWIYPEENEGTIISGPGIEVKMSDLPGVDKNTRWYHIALVGNQLIIDGLEVGIINGTGTAGKTIIGAHWDASSKAAIDFYSGWIDEMRIWDRALTKKQIRFMMNQRLDLSSKSPGAVVQGEVVPNLTMLDGISSYYTNGGHNLDAEGIRFYDVSWDHLIAYYRLISEIPDPALGIIPNTYKPVNGYTPNLALSGVDGRLNNMTTHQQNTSPTPYLSGSNGDWMTDATWARPEVWDYPNGNGVANDLESKSSVIDWNIAKISHNISSGNKEITMLGLLSLQNLLNIEADHFIRISHYLLLNGNIDLKGKSQLLQDHGSLLDNSSSGWLEVNQQGRMSSFNYNYWTSPVTDLAKNNNSGYTLDTVLFDGDLESGPSKVNFKPGYYVADAAKTSPITISKEWIWDFRGGAADVYNNWQFMGSDFRQIVGAGYSMKGTDGTVAPNQETQNYTFRGKPNNGNIPVVNVAEDAELKLGPNQNYLVGNPYPSAIDTHKFLEDNLNNLPNNPGTNEKGQNVFNGTLYYWDHFSGSTHILEEYIGGYATYNLSGSAEAISNDWRINVTGDQNTGVKPKQFIPVAQGFFLNSQPLTVGSTTYNFSGDIIFKNTQRVYKRTNVDASIFLQQEEDVVKGQLTRNDEDTRIKIRLKFESPKGYHRQILVTRDEKASNGFDLGYDAPLIENNVEDMYWWMGNHGFVIQGVPDFEKEQILPLAIKTNDGGEFKIKIDKTENWPTGKELYLKDKLNDTIHDILKDDYISTTESIGEITDRFELIFFKEKIEIPIPDDLVNPDDLPNIDGLVGISYSTFSKQVKISNFDLLDVNKVMIFDMGGKLIQEYDELPTEKEILLGMRPVRSGVYIVKVFSEKGISNKKVVIK